MTQRTFRTQTPLQALVVGQALLLARQLKQTADGAPDGQVLARVEALAVPAARDLARQAVEQALVKMRQLADAEDIRSIAIPRIGVGYGGLSWPKVRAIVERVFGQWSGRLVVYEGYTPAE
jgi:hypothetical protein